MIPLGLYGAARPGAAGVVPLTATYLQTISHSDPTERAITWTDVNLGTASADRTIILTIGFSGGSWMDISSVTIGGVTANLDTVVHSGTSGGTLAVVSAAIPTGTTGTVVVNVATGVPSRVHCGLWAVTGGAVSVVDSDFGSYADGASQTLTLDAVDGGIVIAHAWGGGYHTWTGVTERWDLLAEAHSSGGDAATTGSSHSVTNSTTAARRVQAITYRGA